MDKLGDRWQLFLISANAPWRARWIWISVIAAPICWIATLRILGGLFRSAQDPLALATTLSAIIGGIFVAGGLVVALAAVVTLLSIDERVDKRIGALGPELLQRANAQIEAYLDMREARDKLWPEAVDLIERALTKYPALVGARRQLGLQLVEDIQRHFMLERGMTHVMIPFSQTGAPPSLAAVWLVRAREHLEDADGVVTASLALLAGIERQYEIMLKRIGELPPSAADRPTWGEWLGQPDRLALLAAACGTDGARLSALGGPIGIPLPLTQEVIEAEIRRLGDEMTPNSNDRSVALYVAGRPGLWPDGAAEHFPVAIWLLIHRTDPGTLIVNARVRGSGTQFAPEEFGRPDYIAHPSGGQTLNTAGLRSPEIVAADLHLLCWVIAFAVL